MRRRRGDPGPTCFRPLLSRNRSHPGHKMRAIPAPGRLVVDESRTLRAPARRTAALTHRERVALQGAARRNRRLCLDRKSLRDAYQLRWIHSLYPRIDIGRVSSNRHTWLKQWRDCHRRRIIACHRGHRCCRNQGPDNTSFCLQGRAMTQLREGSVSVHSFCGAILPPRWRSLAFFTLV